MNIQARMNCTLSRYQGNIRYAVNCWGWIMKIAILSLVFISYTSALSAATYYIDYSAANDSANGTSKSTPWKRHPYMTGWAGSYSHSAGDRFIFKGGVTWPRTCFPMTVAAGGSSGSRDYYGVDATWFTGGSFARPAFDLNGAPIGSGASAIQLKAQSNITIDNIEIKNLRYSRNGSYHATSIGMYGSSNITIQNSLVRDWTCVDCYTTGDDGACSGGICGGGGSNLVVDNCTFYASVYGGAVKDVSEVKNSTIHDVPNGILGVRLIHDNLIYNILNAPDAVGLHENAIECFGPCTVYNNIIYNTYAVSLLASPCWGGSCGNSYFFNNVFWNGPVFTIDDDRGDYSISKVYIFNNTIHGGTGPALRFIRGGRLGQVYIVNNHLITDNPTAISIETTINSLTNTSNLKQTQAQATSEGYTSGNSYAPTSPSSPTVNKGTDVRAYFALAGISTPMDRLNVPLPSGAWSIGAYLDDGGQPEPIGQPKSTMAPTGLKITGQ